MATAPTPWQVLVAILQHEDVPGAIDGLIEAGFPGPTRIDSVGGFLGEPNATLLVAVESSRVTEALRTLAAHCRTRTRYVHPLPPLVDAHERNREYPLEVDVGGATVFILPVERYERW